MASQGQRIGEYLLDARVGAGAFGEVWKARHHVWADQVVAIKLPTDPQYLKSLQREGVAIHGLVHPNIVRAIGFDPYADPPYLITEFVPGSSLRPFIRDRQLAPEDAVAVMLQVLAGLAHAHGNKVLHRDIKPENILIHEQAGPGHFDVDGAVKLADFGLGRVAGDAAESIAFSTSINTPQGREIAGTLDYMAPEMRNHGAEAADERVDLYACGVVLFEMLTGERPAGTEVPSDINPAVPKHLDEVFRRSYSRLDKRFQSAEEFRAALQPGAARAVAAPATPGTCPHCRRPVGRQDQFCMHCGVQIATAVRRCGKCGAYPEAGDKYCVFCGEALAPPVALVV